jgi:nitroreductase
MFSVSDASRAIQSMILTAWSERVGSNWVGFRGLDEVKSLLSIPDELEVLAIIPFGYPAQPIGKGKKSASRSPKSPTSSDSGSPLDDVGSEDPFSPLCD